MRVILKTSLVLLALAAGAVRAQEGEADVPQPQALEDSPPAAVDASVTGAGDGVDGAPEAVLPAPFPVSRYEAAWAKNPFLRRTVVTAAPKENFGKDWALNGMANIEGKIRVTLVNKQTGEYKRVTNLDGPEKEFQLVKANFSRNRSEASVEIKNGNEVATLTYDADLSSKPITVNNTQAAPAGAQPNQGAPVPLPGAAPRPGQPVTAAPAAPQQVRPGGVQAVVNRPGAPAVQAGVQPAVNSPAPPAPRPGAAPTISRRRQLVPAPVIQPPQQ